jgi:hypothetical protein
MVCGFKRAARVTQRLDAPVVRNHVAELNDFWNAAEVLDQTGRAAEGLPCLVVDGDLAVVEIGVRNPPKVLVDEILNYAQILTDGGRAHLLVVANNQYGLSDSGTRV